MVIGWCVRLLRVLCRSGRKIGWEAVCSFGASNGTIQVQCFAGACRCCWSHHSLVWICTLGCIFWWNGFLYIKILLHLVLRTMWWVCYMCRELFSCSIKVCLMLWKLVCEYQMPIDSIVSYMFVYADTGITHFWWPLGKLHQLLLLGALQF